MEALQTITLHNQIMYGFNFQLRYTTAMVQNYCKILILTLIVIWGKISSNYEAAKNNVFKTFDTSTVKF